MWPIIFRVGDAALFSYTLLVSFAYFTALGVWLWLGQKRGLSTKSLVNLSLIAAFSGFLGARLLFIVTQMDRFLEGEFSLLQPWQGGVVFLGGFVAASLTLYILVPRFKISRWDAFELGAPAIAFAHAVGRIGCFLNGCCFGHPTDLWWGVTYTDPYSAAPLNEALHPSQMYETIGLIAIGLFLLRRTLRPNPEGILARRSNFALYLGLYAVLRFSVEFTRGDLYRGFWGPLSTSQWISIGLFFCALFLDLKREWGHN